MRSAAWRGVAGLFDSVVDLAPAEREARMREMAGSDRTLVREVRELVRASGRSGNGDFIAATVAAMANEMTVGRRIAPSPGSDGRFRYGSAFSEHGVRLWDGRRDPFTGCLPSSPPPRGDTRAP